MIRVFESFPKFYAKYIRAAGDEDYRIIVSLVARYADAPDLYDELLNLWPSFHDLTGKRVAFISAGAPANPHAFATTMPISETPILARTLNSYEHELLLPSERDFEVTPKSPQPLDFRQEHTLRIQEIKSHLNISESQIPCLHFYFVSTRESKIALLDGVQLPLYDRFKELSAKWEKVFERDKAIRLLRHDLIRKINMIKSDKVRRIEHRKVKVQKNIKRLPDILKQDFQHAYDAAIVVPDGNPREIDAVRNEAFARIRQLRQKFGSNIRPSILSELNALIDLTSKIGLSKIAESELAEVNRQLSELDRALIEAVDEVFSSQVNQIQRSTNQRSQSDLVNHDSLPTVNAQNVTIIQGNQNNASDRIHVENVTGMGHVIGRTGTSTITAESEKNLPQAVAALQEDDPDVDQNTNQHSLVTRLQMMPWWIWCVITGAMSALVAWGVHKSDLLAEYWYIVIGIVVAIAMLVFSPRKRYMRRAQGVLSLVTALNILPGITLLFTNDASYLETFFLDVKGSSAFVSVALIGLAAYLFFLDYKTREQ